ncbi:MAG: hypothetical protein J0M09_00105 [Xanthomonadales bacterium]|nr:hypothetical protein [Xanthomonadales bacterium]
MTMYRPLMTKGIEHLEQLFKNSAGDAKTLRRLVDELACRSTARASSLLAAVQSSLNAQGEVLTDAANPQMREQTTQLTLLPGIPAEPSVPITATAAPQNRPRPAVVVQAASEPPIPARQAPAQVSMDGPNPTLTIEAAYRFLKVSSSAPWSTIESARREIVQKANPEALGGEPNSSRATIVERAAKANEASARVWRERYPTLA